MKTTLPKKSQSHSETINQITSSILKTVKNKISAIILFGSFARGDWAVDDYVQEGILYKFSSDYDILIITNSTRNATLQGGRILKEKIKEDLDQKYLNKNHRPSFIIESFEKVNKELKNNRYFFTDIKKEGILLYAVDGFKLAETKPLSKKKRKEIAREDYKHWKKNADELLIGCYNGLKRGSYEIPAFYLHQTTESLYHCAILTITGYKHKIHNLDELETLCSKYSAKFLTIFPKNKRRIKPEKHRSLTKLQLEKLYKSKNKATWYELLKFAYTEARYNKHYKITKEQLEYLIERVEKLRDLVAEVCRDKI